MPSLHPVPLLQGSDLARFNSKILVTSGCWLWQGKLSQGYGRFRSGECSTTAHRFAYVLAGGVLWPGMEIDHLCGIRACVNHAHLEQVAPRVNGLRSDLTIHTINTLKEKCPAGHPYSGDNLRVRRGFRECRECDRVRVRARRAAHA